MFVEGVGDLQPIDEGDTGYVLVAVVHQGHLVLEVINVALQTLLSFHLYREEVVAIPLKFPPRSKLVVCIRYLMEVSERFPRKRVKAVVGDSFDAGRECSVERRSS